MPTETDKGNSMSTVPIEDGVDHVTTVTLQSAASDECPAPPRGSESGEGSTRSAHAYRGWRYVTGSGGRRLAGKDLKFQVRARPEHVREAAARLTGRVSGADPSRLNLLSTMYRGGQRSRLGGGFDVVLPATSFVAAEHASFGLPGAAGRTEWRRGGAATACRATSPWHAAMR